MARAPRVKPDTVILVTPEGEEREFQVSHAERLLDMGPIVNGGWALPANSNYEYTDLNGLRLKSNKGPVAETAKA